MERYPRLLGDNEESAVKTLTPLVQRNRDNYSLSLFLVMFEFLDKESRWLLQIRNRGVLHG
jgi:hypothetical protein